MTNEIVVFGVGGFGREVHEMLVDINRVSESFEILGFVDGNADLHGSLVHDLPVLGGIEWLRDHPGVSVVLALGSPAAKCRVREQMYGFEVEFPTIISPRAWVGENVVFGQGCIVCAGAIVTTDVSMGDFCTLNLNVTIGHDVVIADYVTLAPAGNISGNVEISDGCDFGTNVAVIPSVKIGEWSIVGAGAVVTRDIPANVTAVGSPAKAIKEREAGWHH